MTGCSYTKRDDHSFYYHNTTESQRPIHQTIQQINNQPTQHTKSVADEDYVSQYKQADDTPSVVYTPPRLPKYKVVYNGREEYHTPVVYTPPSTYSYGDERHYMYRNYRNVVYVSRPGY